MASLCRSEQQKFEPYDSLKCQNEIASQLDFIWCEASDCGLVLNYQGLNDWASEFEQDAGAEHLAVLNPCEMRVYKRTIGSLSGELFGVEKLPVPYLLNQGLISIFFGTDSRFEGISRRPGEGSTEFLISQKFIKAEDPQNPCPTRDELLGFFSRKNFVLSEDDPGQSAYVNEDLGLAITDSHPGNFIVNKDGIKPFDVHFEIVRVDAIAAVTGLVW